MKDLLSKEHYCYKIHTLIKSSAHPHPLANHPIRTLLHFYKKILIFPSMIFQKSQPPYTYFLDKLLKTYEHIYIYSVISKELLLSKKVLNG